MINYVFKLIQILFLLSLSACASAPDTPSHSTWWHDKGDSNLQSGIEAYRNYLYPDAVRDFEKALKYYQGYDDQANLFNTHLNLAKTWLAMDEIDRASEQVLSARKLNRLNPDADNGMQLDIVESSVALEQQDYERVQALLKKYPVDATKFGDARYAAILINQLRAAIKTGEDNTSLMALMKALSTQSENYHARYLRFQAQLSSDENQVDELMQQALSIYRKRSNPRGVLSTYHEWVAYLETQQRYKLAEEKLLVLYDVCRSVGNHRRAVDALEHLTSIYQLTGESDKLELINQARQLLLMNSHVDVQQEDQDSPAVIDF